MVKKLGVAFKAIDTFNEKTGPVVSFLAIVLMVLVLIGVVTRYVFHVSFIWGLPISRQVFGVYILFAGVYALLVNKHIRIEILYERFSSQARFYAGIVDLIAFLVFMGVLIWQSGWMAGNAIINKEVSQGIPKVPLYIIKTFMPAVAFLFLLQGISAFLRKDKEKETR
jgi:TRAP-type mannitol/chloroaromatic compound transport system permease small subunit